MNASASRFAGLVGGIAIAAVSVLSTGCQIDVAGQTLPSPYYQTDDIQFFPAGPEFQLQNEADAMKQYQAERSLGLDDE